MTPTLAAALHPEGVLRSPGRDALSTMELIGLAERLADAVRIPGSAAPQRIWLATDDPALLLPAALTLADGHSCLLVSAALKPPEYDRLAETTWPDLVLTDPGAAGLWQWAKQRQAACAEIGALLARETVTVEPGAGEAGAPGIGFFTSGTTGRPKHIGFTPAQIVTAAGGVADRLRLCPADTGLALSPLNHTLGFVTTVLAPLLRGGRVTVGGVRDVAALAEVTERDRPTWCASVPAVLSQLQRLSESGRISLPELRLLRGSAAALGARRQVALAEHFGVPVVSAYVMTEAPGELASQGLPPEVATPGTVGHPTLCEIEVRDEQGRVVTGEPGEIWARGAIISAGARTVEGWLPTADLGVRAANGELTVLGRLDDVINCGGENVLAYEVETAAQSCPGVTEAVAYPVPDELLGATVGLVLTASPGVTRSQLRKHLMGLLSTQKLPRTFLAVEDIPRTPRGKISRRQLHTQLAALASVTELP
ncbi:fatty acid--CoA ligase family protein [Crossiella sp. SN42]|uniref:class I adenylate-forming enzyme family protein n=1 Tax=Crossiella sp. SN42 TaxID=2944808 RepID=UPI00207D36F1|nr:fatty acid--CoA ligase family protein [Crossiella sp. SN42]MCO1577297.1 fatty acid--CoA ligase family protein [Crossiella sp. SN42]